jgi:hypothetical protein
LVLALLWLSRLETSINRSVELINFDRVFSFQSSTSNK